MNTKALEPLKNVSLFLLVIACMISPIQAQYNPLFDFDRYLDKRYMYANQFTGLVDADGDYRIAQKVLESGIWEPAESVFDLIPEAALERALYGRMGLESYLKGIKNKGFTEADALFLRAWTAATFEEKGLAEVYTEQLEKQFPDYLHLLELKTNSYTRDLFSPKSMGEELLKDFDKAFEKELKPRDKFFYTLARSDVYEKLDRMEDKVSFSKDAEMFRSNAELLHPLTTYKRLKGDTSAIANEFRNKVMPDLPANYLLYKSLESFLIVVKRVEGEELDAFIQRTLGKALPESLQGARKRIIISNLDENGKWEDLDAAVKKELRTVQGHADIKVIAEDLYAIADDIGMEMTASQKDVIGAMAAHPEEIEEKHWEDLEIEFGGLEDKWMRAEVLKAELFELRFRYKVDQLLFEPDNWEQISGVFLQNPFYKVELIDWYTTVESKEDLFKIWDQLKKVTDKYPGLKLLQNFKAGLAIFKLPSEEFPEVFEPFLYHYVDLLYADSEVDTEGDFYDNYRYNFREYEREDFEGWFRKIDHKALLEYIDKKLSQGLPMANLEKFRKEIAGYQK